MASPPTCGATSRSSCERCISGSFEEISPLNEREHTYSYRIHAIRGEPRGDERAEWRRGEPRGDEGSRGETREAEGRRGEPRGDEANRGETRGAERIEKSLFNTALWETTIGILHKYLK